MSGPTDKELYAWAKDVITAMKDGIDAIKAQADAGPDAILRITAGIGAEVLRVGDKHPKVTALREAHFPKDAKRINAARARIKLRTS